MLDFEEVLESVPVVVRNTEQYRTLMRTLNPSPKGEDVTNLSNRYRMPFEELRMLRPERDLSPELASVIGLELERRNSRFNNLRRSYVSDRLAEQSDESERLPRRFFEVAPGPKIAPALSPLYVPRPIPGFKYYGKPRPVFIPRTLYSPQMEARLATFRTSRHKLRCASQQVRRESLFAGGYAGRGIRNYGYKGRYYAPRFKNYSERRYRRK